MNRKIIISTIIAMSLAAGGSAFAQSNDHRNDQDHGHGDQDSHRDIHADAHNVERGAGPNHDFHKGGRISNQYRSKQYVVNDWRGHHLHAPPRGYHWVQTGPDYVLVAVTSGLIAQIVLGN